ncbi:MAG: GNAT family N-acetyltransferase [Chitinispirillaceae bacterium]|nr:GNAT family N-acetyltransferase [Chitinispirillaceae bacterium]
MLEVKCITEVSDLRILADQWEQLLFQSLHNSYSLSWSWISHWVDTFIDQNRLLCIAVYDENQLVGMGPFWIEQKKQLFHKTRILRFLGVREICPDHLDLIVHTKNSENICNAIWEHLFGKVRKEWDIWEYNNVSIGSTALKYFYTIADQDRRCLGLNINGFMANPYIDLPETWEKYLSSLKSKKRWNLKVATNLLLEAGTVELTFCETVQDLPSYMDTHITLHRNSWKERGKSGSFGSKRFKQFHYNYAKEQLMKGNLFLCNLVLNNIPVGSFYGFVHNKVLIYYLIGTNRKVVPGANVGKVLIAKCIEEAIRRGYTKFDFLRGIEPYKYDWTSSEQRELLVTFYNRSWKAMLHILAQFTGTYGRQLFNIVFKDKMSVVKRFLGRGTRSK